MVKESAGCSKLVMVVQLCPTRTAKSGLDDLTGISTTGSIKIAGRGQGITPPCQNPVKAYSPDDVLLNQLPPVAGGYYALVSDGDAFIINSVASKTGRILEGVMHGKMKDAPFVEVQAFISSGNRVVAS